MKQLALLPALALVLTVGQDVTQPEITTLEVSVTYPSVPAVVVSTFTVTNTNNAGPGSLRQAILAANANSGIDAIHFNIPGAGPHTIQPASVLPLITDPVVIDGYTQPGASPNTNEPGLGLNTVLKIELDGSNAGASAEGLSITARNSTVRGLVINRFDLQGVLIGGIGATGNLVQGNFIGTDVNGAVALPNRGGGVFIERAPNNTIGGTTAGARNIISGNANDGVSINGVGAQGNLVQGNLIGTDVTGTAAIGNGNAGVLMGLAANNTIGGTTPGARNVISGNLEGVTFDDAGGNLVQGNYIGTDVTGTSAIGNVAGVLLLGSGNTIGGTSSGAGNTIAFNGIGVNVDLSATGNAILSNSIFSNTELGIDLDADGVTANDAGDGDTGPNNLQNFPSLTSALRGSTTIEGTFNSAANTDFRLEFFSNRACDPSDHGEGETFLGTASVTTDANGDASFTVSIASTIDPFITATATDPDNNTSEFSQCVTVLTDYTVAVSPSSVTVTGGSPATYTVTISPLGGSLDDPVSLTCSDLPDLTSCSFSPSSLTPGPTDATSTLTVTTRAPTASLTPPVDQRDHAPMYALWQRLLWLGLPGLGLVVVILGGGAKTRSRHVLLLTVAILLLSGCGGGDDGVTRPPPSPGTPTGTFAFTITATSGSLERSTTATLIVQ